jgi:hypothetical protein
MDRIERVGPPGHEAAPIPPVQRLTVREREEQARERERRRREHQRRRGDAPQPEDPGEGHVDIRA